MTQETTTVKIWGEFNLAILKVNLNPLWMNRSFTIATYTTNILLLPTNRNLLTRQRASSETTDSFFLRFFNKYKHTRLCFFKLFSAAIEWSSSSWTKLLLITLSLCKKKLLTNLTRDLHKPQYEQSLKRG